MVVHHPTSHYALDAPSQSDAPCSLSSMIRALAEITTTCPLPIGPQQPLPNTALLKTRSIKSAQPLKKLSAAPHLFRRPESGGFPARLPEFRPETMMSSGSSGRLSGGSAEESEIGWEMRPCGMLVQTRAADPGPPAAPEVRLRISHGNARYEVSISSEASFGELKKLLSEKTGLQPGEQKLLYKGKEKANREFLDACGIKNRSKIVLEADPLSMERRYVEMKKNAKIQSAQRAISAVSLEVDKLADQVTTIDKSITNGNMVAEVQITTLIELFMRQAVKLDSITTEGDTCSQKNLQVKRVQKWVETLDLLKISNAKVKPVVVTTKWETFESPTTTQWECFD